MYQIDDTFNLFSSSKQTLKSQETQLFFNLNKNTSDVTF